MFKKSFFKAISLILSLTLVSSFAVMFTACGEEEKKPEPTPAPHTHTYASTWSNDETNHWHAATCEHKSEVKDKAAHTFTGNKCTVCNFEKEEEPAPAVEKCKCDPACIVCPECGGCIDTDCTETECIKCGDGLTSHEFEAENCELIDGRLGFEINDQIDESEPPCTYVQRCMGNLDGKLIFKITSDKAGTATLRVRNAKNRVKSIFTEWMVLTVNGNLIERESYVNEPEGEINRKRDFDWTNLGCIELVEGENIIEFNIAAPEGEHGYNMDKIDIMTEAGFNLTWEPIDNSDRKV